MLDYSKLKNIANIDENNVYLKNGKTFHTDNFTFLGTFENQKQLEDFDKNFNNLFFNNTKTDKIINFSDYINKNR